MGNFIRVMVLVILALVGFGSGICGLFGLGASLLDSMGSKQSGGENFTGVVVAFSVVGLIIAALCAWAIRAILRRHAAAASMQAPPAPPSAP